MISFNAAAINNHSTLPFPGSPALPFQLIGLAVTRRNMTDLLLLSGSRLFVWNGCFWADLSSEIPTGMVFLQHTIKSWVSITFASGSVKTLNLSLWPETSLVIDCFGELQKRMEEREFREFQVRFWTQKIASSSSDEWHMFISALLLQTAAHPSSLIDSKVHYAVAHLGLSGEVTEQKGDIVVAEDKQGYSESIFAPLCTVAHRLRRQRLRTADFIRLSQLLSRLDSGASALIESGAEGKLLPVIPEFSLKWNFDRSSRGNLVGNFGKLAFVRETSSLI